MVPSGFSQSVTYADNDDDDDCIGSPTSPDDKESLTQNFDNENTLAK